ncbi:hypothetical protein [Neobacillus sp. YIM B06451]|uniref:hypothetical protein n=1 Tax=Neobacillus sp. YIM B06451 TaxID=3070994 RepID=UPI0029310CAB|nr:hypothetical protein [Neobacillus sp. YIM B06451]
MAKKIALAAVILLAAGILAFFNPTENDYIAYSNEYMFDSHPDEIEKTNLLVLSIYTPVIDEKYGISHLGIMGQFIELSEENFNLPIWVEFFFR